MNKLERAIFLLQEEVYGNLATVYHRTSYHNLVNAIYAEGFKPGIGDMYGKGFYSTYDVASQEKENMKNSYGDLVVKFVVPVDNFFILDYTEFIKSPIGRKLKSSKENFIEDQINHFKLVPKRYNNIKNILSYINRVTLSAKGSNVFFTSDIARVLHNDTDLKKKVKGIIYTGRRDGKCLLAYDTSIITPTSSKKDGEEFKPIEKSQEQNKYRKEVLKSKLTPYESKNRNRNNTFAWTKVAKTKNAEAEIKDGELVWHDGEWLEGTWKDGTWEKGRWHNGTWEDGVWRGGWWENGIWENGVFLKGTWSNGTWEDGIWQGEEWYDGIWKDGIWEDGTWIKGTWKGGTWENGWWEGGIWEKGWIYDPEKEGNFKEDWKWRGAYIESPISPKEYFSKEKNLREEILENI